MVHWTGRVLPSRRQLLALAMANLLNVPNFPTVVARCTLKTICRSLVAFSPHQWETTPSAFTNKVTLCTFTSCDLPDDCSSLAFLAAYSNPWNRDIAFLLWLSQKPVLFSVILCATRDAVSKHIVQRASKLQDSAIEHTRWRLTPLASSPWC